MFGLMLCQLYYDRSKLATHTTTHMNCVLFCFVPSSTPPIMDPFFVQHICADTMRSTAVLLAAGIAICIPTSNHIEEQYYAVLADSMAALIVSLIILLSIVPLLQAIYHTGQQIIQWHGENHHHHPSTKELHSCPSPSTSYQSITV